MKILIDGQTLLTPDIARGIGKYFINSIENILQYDFTNDFYLNTPPGPHLNVLSPWARGKLRILDNEAYDIRVASKGHRPHREQLYSEALNNDIEKLGINVYWSPNSLMDNVVLPSRRTSNCEYAVTIFDLIVSVLEKEYAKHWPASSIASYKNKLKRLERDFDLYLHISRHTESDFLETLEVRDKRHVVTPLAADTCFYPSVFPSVAAAVDYVIYPGGFDPRKNMERALQAFASLQTRYGQDEKIRSTQLFIVCRCDKAGETHLLDQAKRLGLSGKVWLTGFIDNSRLVDLYQKARCLFFPSLYEGFGLPVLEGLACGLPVAVSNTSSLPEVGGDLAIYFDPCNVDDMADALYRALQAPMDFEWKSRRYEYSKGFAWKKTALAILNAFTGRAADVKEANNDAECLTLVSKKAIDSDLIDVRKRMSEWSVEELCETAEEFFARIDNWDYLHAKPFASVNETPELLINFALLVHGLNLLPDMTIVDFGAGSCWSSRFLSQLGLRVVAVDVSSSALKIGENLYKRLPLVGDQLEPRFLVFNGRTLEVPNESVDRISCWDAFHHVPNPAEVLKEMARVLKPGGIAGFSEPGPEHSKSPQSQYEMRTNRLIENDTDMAEIWFAAQAAGFTDIRLALFSPNPLLLPLEHFEKFLSGEDSGERYVAQTRNEMKHRRVFFLFKGESSEPSDSRQRSGLVADLKVELISNHVKAGDSLFLNVVVKNTGKAVWLPSTARIGGVRFGIHLFDETGKLLDLDYFRNNLTRGEGRAIMPGETIEFVAEIPMPSTGAYTLQCDLVSEAVCWFEHNGSPTVRLEVKVI